MGGNDLSGVLIVDYQVLFNTLVGLCGLLGGWVLNNLTTNIRSVTADLKSLDARHQETRETYVTKTDHQNDLAHFNHRFDRIDDKLDGIAKDLAHRT